MPSLHEISSEIENALTALDDYEGPEDERRAVEAALVPYLADLADQEAAKVDSIAYVDRRAAKEIAFLKDEEARIKAKRQSLERRRESFRDFLRQVMVGHGLKKITGHDAILSLRASEAVDVEDPQVLPPEYVDVVIERRPKCAEIKAALKAGVVIPGCQIIRGQTVQVR